MQVNDPARDLAWIFAKLDENHRNALLSAYGRMLGNRLDDLIMLRANLWLQMEQVGDFISALNKADNAKINAIQGAGGTPGPPVGCRHSEESRAN